MTKKLCVQSTSVGSDISDISCFHHVSIANRATLIRQLLQELSDLGLLCSVCKSVKRHLNEVINTLIKRSDALFGYTENRKSPTLYIIHLIVLKFVGINGFILCNSQPRGMRVTDSYL